MKENEHYEMVLAGLTQMFVEHIPFHEHLGITAHRQQDALTLQLEMSKHLIGNSITKILHGGVIATLLDASGGLTAFAEVLKKLDSTPTPEQVEQLSKGATIDLRVDYLRPGTGKYFTASSEVLRTGSRVTVTRMALHNDEDKLIAVGSGTYLIEF